MNEVLTIVKELAITFISLFVAVDAIGVLPFVLLLTQDISSQERPTVVRYAMITAFALGLGFIAIGKGIFFVLGIKVADFLVAGGLILLILSIRHMLTGKIVELQTGSTRGIVGVVPIGTPLVVGPAVLTTLLLLIDQYSLPVVLVSFVLNLAFAWLVFAQANRVTRLLGEQGLRASSQIASLLLAAIAVMMVRKGIIEILG